MSDEFEMLGAIIVFLLFSFLIFLRVIGVIHSMTWLFIAFMIIFFVAIDFNSKYEDKDITDE